MKNKILIIEDDIDIVNILQLYLESDGYIVEQVYDGESALEYLTAHNDIDLAIMDIMLPRLDGYQLLKKLRQYSDIPVIIASAKTQDNDKIIGLELGADDYITKPFNPLEVLSRVKALLRRIKIASECEAVTAVTYGDLTVETATMTLKKDNQSIPLTMTEYKILLLLLSNPGKIYTKSQIYEVVRGDFTIGDENTIMVYISKLREKLEDNSKDPKYLITVRGLGYKIEKSI
ncbi:MAG: response regulator transcription factor [Clostridia bacterium]